MSKIQTSIVKKSEVEISAIQASFLLSFQCFTTSGKQYLKTSKGHYLAKDQRMSNPYITPTHQTIGDYKITDKLFDASFLDTTIEQFKSISATFGEKISQNANDILSLYASAEYAVASVDNLKLSVDDLYVSANYIPDLVLSVSNALQRLDGHDGDIAYLSSVLSTLNLKALRHAITNVGILRPDDSHELYLKIDVFDSAEMSAKLGDIDLSDANDQKYFEALLVNNGENNADLTIDPLRSEYFPGTQWVSPEVIDAAIKEYGTPTGFKGYGPAFNNSPVNISFLAWLEDNDLAQNLTQQSKFYLRFVWYYLDDGVHSSDHFSMVVPSYAEVGAKAGSSVSKSEIYEIKQALETQVATASYTTEEDDQHPIQGYYVNPYQCTILEDFASKPKNIILQSYSEGKTYKLKFRTGSSDVTVGNSASTTSIRFNANYGNGPEGVDELNASNIVFTANTTYLIALNLGMIQVIAKI